MNNLQFEYDVRPVVGYEGLYSVSNVGEVFSHDYRRTGQTKQLKPTNVNGYLQVCLCQDGKVKQHRVHRLVLEAFVPNPDNKFCCDHIDTNKANNHVSNLRWVTAKENSNNPITRKNNSNAQKGRTHAEETRRKMSEAKKGKKHPYYKHTMYKFRNKKSGEEFVGTQYDFRNRYNLDQSAVSCLVNGTRKSHKNWVIQQQE